MSADRNFSTPIQNTTSLSRFALIQQAATRSGALPPAGQTRNSKMSIFDVSQMSGVSISMAERGKIERQEFISELEWLRHESETRCFLDAELWTNEILANMPEKWCSPGSLFLPSSHTAAYDSSQSSITSPQGQTSSSGSSQSNEMPRLKQEYISKFAVTLMKNKEFRRAAHYFQKTMNSNKLDKFLYYRSLFLACFLEHMENDSEGIERRTSFPEGSNPFAVLYQKMTDEQLRENNDVWFEYLMALLEVQMGLKIDAEKSFRNVITREPRIWPAWEGLSLLISDIEDADKFSTNPEIRSVWMSDWFMVLVLQRFHQDTMAIHKAEQLVGRGMSGIPMIISKIAVCSNARHDHEQAISNFESIRKTDPFRLTDLHLLSDSYYIRGDLRSLADFALEMFKVHKFRWETCCVVANYHSLRRDSESAIRFFQRAIRLNPGIAAIWVLIGHEFMEMKNNAAACVSYRRAIEIDPVDHRGWYGLGQMYDIMRMPAYSLFYYQEAQKCKPHDSRLLVALGDVYKKLSRFDDAEKCFTGAYLFGDVEGNALWSLAKVHETVKDKAKAAQVYEVFLVVYENVTSAEDKVIYAISFLANYFFDIRNLDKAHDFANKCLAYETICQDGTRLCRLISKIHIREARAAQKEAAQKEAQLHDSGEGITQQPDAPSAPEGDEEAMSEGEDELSF